MPRGVRSTDNMQVGQNQSHIMPAFGPVDVENFADQFQVVDGPEWPQKADALAFMEEPVMVRLATTTDPNAERFPHVGVNGVNQFFERGKPQVVKRKFVEALARSKPVTVKTLDAKDFDGNDTKVIEKTTGIRYPFEVLRDDNPRGPAWLSKVLAEG